MKLCLSLSCLLVILALLWLLQIFWWIKVTINMVVVVVWEMWMALLLGKENPWEGEALLLTVLLRCVFFLNSYLYFNLFFSLVHLLMCLHGLWYQCRNKCGFKSQVLVFSLLFNGKFQYVPRGVYFHSTSIFFFHRHTCRVNELWMYGINRYTSEIAHALKYKVSRGIYYYDNLRLFNFMVGKPGTISLG